MTVFLTLLVKLIPLYVFILFGFLVGKFLKVQKESIATILIYIVAPVIFFNAAVTTPITLANMFFPIVCFALCLTILLIDYSLGKNIWKDGTANLFGYVGSMGNLGYFGLPVAIAVLPKEFVNIYLLGALGMNILDVSGAYFLVAKGKHTIRESFLHVVTLPTIYAFLVGLLIQVLHVPLGAGYADLIVNFKGTYIILGMMLVGLGIADMPSLSFNFLFLGLTFASKFLLWPAIAFGVIFLDTLYFHLFSAGLHQVLLLLSIVPVAANSVAYSTKFHLHPHKAALVVFSSTLFALFYVPFFVSIFILGK